MEEERRGRERAERINIRRRIYIYVERAMGGVEGDEVVSQEKREV